jgi:4'-phosphopantetheinyl transferase
MSKLTSANSYVFIKDKLTLQEDEIHIWVTKPELLLGGCLDNLSLLKQYSNLLTEEETIKQQRYKFDKDKHDALITRAFIRDLLSYYADVEPQAWRFVKGEKDKPEIINPPLPLRFNISHTKGLIICAVTLTNDIGCDVENTSRSNDVLAIAERYFSAQESKELFSLTIEQQRDRFFDYWTLKESYIKAWGLGLAIPLTDFTFTIDDKINDKMTSKANSEVNGEESTMASTLKFSIKDNIKLNFASHRIDEPNIWRSWLVYPTDDQKHRIALSLRSHKNIQKTNFSLRFFNTLPLRGYHEII